MTNWTRIGARVLLVPGAFFAALGEMAPIGMALLAGACVLAPDDERRDFSMIAVGLAIAGALVKPW
ncbi:MAG: hypothetical protein E6Q97_02075 [Desulfurellales bacterium]|nr:MAG: hypothetical protein E6Q97_02075 [Desulfurellales bacterium]